MPNPEDGGAAGGAVTPPTAITAFAGHWHETPVDGLKSTSPLGRCVAARRPTRQAPSPAPRPPRGHARTTQHGRRGGGGTRAVRRSSHWLFPPPARVRS